MPPFTLLYALFLASLSVLPCNAAAEDAVSPGSKNRYISGSWVNVRSSPAADAPVAGQVIVNTPVTVKNDQAGSGFCEITYEANKRGYVACRLISDAPVMLKDVGIPFDKDGNPFPSYSATKSFWIQSSVDRLLAAGKHFEAVMLKPGELEAERKAALENGRLMKIRRFAIPEYEAMKERLRSGVKGYPREDWINTFELPKWSAIKAIALKNPTASSLSAEAQSIRDIFLIWGHRDTPMELIRALELPSTKASYFRDAGKLLSPTAPTEAASSWFDIPYRAVVKSGLRWIPAGHYNDGYVFGAWDVGIVEASLISSVKKHTLHRDGTIVSEATNIPGGRYPDMDADGNECDVGFSWGDGGSAINRAAFGTAIPKSKTGNRVFYFYSKDDMPRDKATVVRTKRNFKEAGFESAETFSFDFDGDGVADILMWEGTGISEQSIHDPGSAQAHYRIFFMNISGEWHLFLVDEFLYGCGC